MYNFRELIINEYETIWKSIEKDNKFIGVLIFNKPMYNDLLSDDEIRKYLKIKYFAFILFEKKLLSDAEGLFLSELTITLINSIKN